MQLQLAKAITLCAGDPARDAPNVCVATPTYQRHVTLAAESGSSSVNVRFAVRAGMWNRCESFAGFLDRPPNLVLKLTRGRMLTRG